MTNNSSLVLNIDVGTQSVRCAVVDQTGQVLALERKQYQPTYVSPQPGFAEHNPNYYFDCLVEVCQKMKSNHTDLLSKVVAMGLTTFRDSPVFLDKNFLPVRPMVLWLDQRQAEIKQKLSPLVRFVFLLVGMKETVQLNMKRTPAIWVQENDYKTWEKTEYYCNISTYLTYKLLGEYIDSSANQTGHFPINFKKRQWYKNNALKGHIFRIPNKKLCKLVQPGEILGHISPEISKLTGLPENIPFYATGTDKGNETIGNGCSTPDIASISYGTASSVDVHNKRYYEPETFLPAYASSIPGYYQMEVQIYRGYWMINWFLKEFGDAENAEALILRVAPEKILNDKMLEIPPGSDGLILQPYWGPGLKRPLARGAIVGFSDYHTRLHIYRAIVEGIAFALKEALEGIEQKQHKKVYQLRISGGGSRSSAICQITADIFNRPVSRIQTEESSSLGAAIAVFVAHHVFTSYQEATKAMVHEKDTFIPNPENVEKYAYLYKRIYKKLYPNLSEIYKDIRAYNEKYSITINDR